MFFNFFKTPEVRKFEHVNIYYDPDKEERDERRKRIKEEVAMEHGLSTGHTTLRRGFLSEQRKGKVPTSKTNTIRLALIITLLVAAVAYITH